ncbi:MAG: insulinase family protein [Atopobiaceae bacterium]|nr:insulinase family protein [Atopobiaceae bacterium]
MSDFTMPDPALAIGSTHAGFTVTSIEPLAELSATGYVLRHDASGARVLWIACADTNRSFSIAFKTPPSDDTGVFHILEHSVLCGSERYPVKEPFVNLLKTSMQTFLNALTFPDKTMYPLSSTNVADFENLMDVYLDAVLHPAIYQRPRIFEQEGWHYELDELDGPLVYNGVVFNEMKGALSDPDDVLYQAIGRMLFPDTPYRFESGGNPRAIPTLTYEKFIDTHARHYNLANSYTVLYGDLDIDRELTRLADHFAHAATRDAGEPNPLPLQHPVAAGLSQVTMATAPENATVGLAYVVGTFADRERILATDILLDALAGSNEAPLKRAILDADLADDFQTSLLDSLLQPQLLFQLKGAHEGVAERFRTLLEDTCRSLATNGINRDRLEASLAQAEFNLREGDWGSYSDGVALSMQVMSSWLYDDNHPVDYLRYENELAHMRAGLDEGYFEQLLMSIVVDNPHSAEVELVPTEQGDAAEELSELEARKATMSKDELRNIQAEVAALREEQERPDTPEALATLPRLTVADIGDAPNEAYGFEAEAPLRCIAHELPTRHIDYVYHYFDLRCLSFEELPYATMLCDLMGRLDTASHTAAELDTVVERELGALDFFTETLGKDEDPSFALPMLVVGASALSENVTSLAALPQEVWGTTSFDDLDRIHDILTQRRVSIEQAFTNSGHVAAMTRLSSYFTASALVSGTLNGVDYYLFLKDILANWDDRAPQLAGTLSAIARRVFTADDVTVSFTGSAEDREAFWKAGGTLGLSQDPDSSVQRLVVPEPSIKNEAFITPANVCFVAEGQARSELDGAPIGTWQVASRALSYDYLWNEVRVKGGAYGCGFRRTTVGLQQFWSYRDPGVDGTVTRFENASVWLSNWEADEDELAGYIVSVVAGNDAPVKPRQLARRQDTQFFSGRPDDWRAQVRSEVLATTVESVRALAPSLNELPARRAICVFGSREKIEASDLDLKVIELL